MPKRQKSLSKGFQTKQKKKKFSRCSFRFPFTRRLDDDRLSPLKFCLLKKKILSLSLSLMLFYRPLLLTVF